MKHQIDDTCSFTYHVIRFGRRIANVGNAHCVQWCTGTSSRADWLEYTCVKGMDELTNEQVKDGLNRYGQTHWSGGRNCTVSLRCTLVAEDECKYSCSLAEKCRKATTR